MESSSPSSEPPFKETHQKFLERVLRNWREGHFPNVRRRGDLPALWTEYEGANIVLGYFRIEYELADLEDL